MILKENGWELIKQILIAEIKSSWTFLLMWLFLKQCTINLVSTFMLFLKIYGAWDFELGLLTICCVILIFGWNWLIEMLDNDTNIIVIYCWLLYLLKSVTFERWTIIDECDSFLRFITLIEMANVHQYVYLPRTFETYWIINKGVTPFFTKGLYEVPLRFWIIIGVLLLFAVIPDKYMQKNFTWDTGLLVLLITTFLTLIATANHFFSFYVLLEGINLALIALIALRRYNIWSLEAALKYFVLNGLLNGLLLFSLVLFYYQTNSLAFIAIKYSLTSTSNYYWAVGLFSIAFLFKLSAWPFHAWTPDVYEGAPTWVLFYMALIIKSILFALFIKITFYVFFPMLPFLKFLFYIAGLGSIVVGTFGALWQKSLKRFLAYSTISNTGLCLLALAAFTTSSFLNVSMVLFHLFFYFITTFLIFALYLQLTTFQERRLYFFSDYFTLLYQKKFTIIGKMFLFLSAIIMMAALPPAITFYSKFMLLYCLMQQKYYMTTIIILLLNCIMSYYYLRLIKIFCFEDPRVNIYNTIYLTSFSQNKNHTKKFINIKDIQTTTINISVLLFGIILMFFQWLLSNEIMNGFIYVFVAYAKQSFVMF